MRYADFLGRFLPAVRYRKKRTPGEHLSYWLYGFKTWANAFLKLTNKIDFMKKNPKLCQESLQLYFYFCFTRISQVKETLYVKNLHEIFYRELITEKDILYLIMPLFFRAVIDNRTFIMDFMQRAFTPNKDEPTNSCVPIFSYPEHFKEFSFDILTELSKTNETFLKFKPYITARIEIKLLKTEGDFEIVFLSDEKANVEKPAWFQKDGIGYKIQSYEGKLSFVAKSSVDGRGH